MFSLIGSIKRIDLLANRQICFVEFTDPSDVAKAVGKDMELGGQKVIIEERKKNSRDGKGGHHSRGDNFDRRGGKRNEFQKKKRDEPAADRA